MSDFLTDANMASAMSVGAEAGDDHRIHVEHIYEVECWRDGELVWSDRFKNLVTTAGRNKYLDATLKTGLAAPAWYVGLVTGPGAGNTYAAADTMAAHAGWAENSAYSGGARPAFTPGAVASGSVDNSAAKAVFNVNAGATVAGCFMVDDATTGGATGTLLGVGNFTAGDRAVLSGDTLNVTVTATLT